MIYAIIILFILVFILFFISFSNSDDIGIHYKVLDDKLNKKVKELEEDIEVLEDYNRKQEFIKEEGLEVTDYYAYIADVGIFGSYGNKKGIFYKNILVGDFEDELSSLRNSLVKIKSGELINNKPVKTKTKKVIKKKK